MTKATLFHGLVLFVCGVIVGAMFVPQWRQPETVAAQGQPAGPDLAAMQADIAHLKEVIPSQTLASSLPTFGLQEKKTIGRSPTST